MAKVTGPLFSVGARNKFAGALVYFPWKGLNIVRELVRPSQPRSAGVMNVRIKMKALGLVSKIFSKTSTLTTAMKIKTPEGSVWNADWIGVAISQFQRDNDAFDELKDDLTGAIASATFTSEAQGLGLSSVILSVEGQASDHPVSYTATLALYSLAKACWYRQVLDESEVAYTDPHDWDAAAVTAFAARIVD